MAKHGSIPFLRQHPTEPLRPRDAVTWQRIVGGEPLVHIPGVADTDFYPSGHEVAQAIVDIGGGQTLLTVALRKDDALLGALTVYRHEVRPFTDKQIALLKNFAALAVIAMKNARLLAEQREALEQQTAMAEVLEVINRSPGNLAPVFRAILEKAHTLCGAIIGSLSTYDGVYACRGGPSPAASQRLIDGDRFVHVPDMQELQPRPEGNFGRMSERTGLRTALMIPLRKDGASIGQISAFRTEVRPFAEREIALLETLPRKQ